MVKETLAYYVVTRFQSIVNELFWSLNIYQHLEPIVGQTVSVECSSGTQLGLARGSFTLGQPRIDEGVSLRLALTSHTTRNASFKAVYSVSTPPIRTECRSSSSLLYSLTAHQLVPLGASPVRSARSRPTLASTPGVSVIVGYGVDFQVLHQLGSPRLS